MLVAQLREQQNPGLTLQAFFDKRKNIYNAVRSETFFAVDMKARLLSVNVSTGCVHNNCTYATISLDTPDRCGKSSCSPDTDYCCPIAFENILIFVSYSPIALYRKRVRKREGGGEKDIECDLRT